MHELANVLTALLREVQAGSACALCAVVEITGSTPREAGAAMLARSDGSICNTIGGGYVEHEVIQRALELIPTGGSMTCEFNLSDEDTDGGLVCGGTMTIAIETFSPQSDLTDVDHALTSLQRGEAMSLPIRVQDERGSRLYYLSAEAPITVVIAGAGHVGQAVAKLSLEVGFRVIVIDDRAEFANIERFPEPVQLMVGDMARQLKSLTLDERSFVVIVTRGHEHDRQALEAVLGRGTGYIGVMASRRKAALMLSSLKDAGFPVEQLDSVHTPIGLEIGSVSVPEIAVSIVAQLIQKRKCLSEPIDTTILSSRQL